MAFNRNVEEDGVDYGVDYTTYEIGTNIYLSPSGKGLYLGISYLSFDGVYTETGYENSTGDFKFNTTNLKLGVKLGRTFYFRAEVGYGFGDIPEEIILTIPDGPDDVIEIPDIPGLASSGLPVFNIGFGFSFL